MIVLDVKISFAFFTMIFHVYFNSYEVCECHGTRKTLVYLTLKDFNLKLEKIFHDYVEEVRLYTYPFDLGGGLNFFARISNSCPHVQKIHFFCYYDHNGS